MTYVLVQGVLFRDPESKVSASGKAYVSATLREQVGDASNFWRLMIFSELAGEEVMRLRAGAALAAQGSARFELYTPPNGEPRISLSLMVNAVLPVRPAKKKAKESDAGEGDGYSRRGSPNAHPAPAQPAPRPQRQAGGLRQYDPGPADRDLDDTIPF